MVWFLLAPVAIYGVKKLYDAINEPDPPSRPSSKPSLESAKVERTKIRSDAIKDCFRAQRSRVRQEIGNIRLANGLGPVIIDDKSSGVVKVEFEGYGQALEILNNARQCLDGRAFDRETYLRLQINVPNAEEWHETLLRKAEADYGNMAGITVNHTYDRAEDPFLTALWKLEALEKLAGWMKTAWQRKRKDGSGPFLA